TSSTSDWRCTTVRLMAAERLSLAAGMRLAPCVQCFERPQPAHGVGQTTLPGARDMRVGTMLKRRIGGAGCSVALPRSATVHQLVQAVEAAVPATTVVI